MPPHRAACCRSVPSARSRPCSRTSPLTSRHAGAPRTVRPSTTRPATTDSGSPASRPPRRPRRRRRATRRSGTATTRPRRRRDAGVRARRPRTAPASCATRRRSPTIVAARRMVPVAVPVRVVPAPRRYGDGTIARSPDLPARIECELHPGSGATRVVAAVTTGRSRCRTPAGTRSPAGATSTLCIAARRSPAPFIDRDRAPSGTAGDLDLYERPDPACRRKIAP